MAKSHIKEAGKIGRLLKKKSAKHTAGGGKLIGRGKGKLAPDDGTKGGYAVGDRHSAPSGGISAKVGTDGKPIKFEGREAVLTAPAMDDERPIHEFDGVKGLTKRQVASRINVLGGGVDFAEKGMIVPDKVKCTGKKYKFGGKMMTDHEIISSCGCQHEKMEKGGLSRGAMMHSPNEEEYISFRRAKESINSPSHKLYKEITDEIDRELNIKTINLSAIGEWTDGVENTVFSDIDDADSYEILKYSAALKGLIGNQKAVLVFLAKEQQSQSIPDVLFSFSVKKTISETRKLLNRKGLLNRTLISVNKHTTRVVIFDKHLEKSEVITNLANTYGSTIKIIQGKGEYIGSETSRKEAASILQNIVSEKETPISEAKRLSRRYNRSVYLQRLAGLSGTINKKHLAQGGSLNENTGKSDNFTSKGISYEVQHILSGNGGIGEESLIKTTADYLRASKTASAKGSNKNLWKQEEKLILARYIDNNSLWVDNAWDENYISEGVEQKVYLFDDDNVIKFNDGIFYSSWLEYFNSLLLHNNYFYSTPYELIGFLKKDDTVFAAVKQPFVKETSLTDLDIVKEFLVANGFTHKKDINYYNPKIGVVLEDLHQGNVLTKDGILYFIDTVFYITDEEGSVVNYEKGGDLQAESHAILVSEIAVLQLPPGLQMYKGHPEELLKFIQEQAIGMSPDRKKVDMPNYNSAAKVFGKKIVLASIREIPAEQKAFILEQYREKRIGYDPAVKKALQEKSMAEGGMFEGLSPDELFVLRCYEGYKPPFRKKGIAQVLEENGQWSKTAMAKAEQLIEGLKQKGMITPQNALSEKGKKIVTEAKEKAGIYKTFLPTSHGEYQRGWVDKLNSQSTEPVIEEIHEERKTISLPANIKDDDTPKNSAEYQHYKNGGWMMAKGGVTTASSEMNIVEFIKLIKKLRPFVPTLQIKALGNIFKGEEKSFAIEKVQELISYFEKMPKTYGTEKQETDDKIVYLHYFYGGSDWYIVEKDSEPEQLQAFGYAILNGDFQQAEWGYISLVELLGISRIELDFYFTPVCFGDIKKKWEDEQDEEKQKESESASQRKYKVGDKIRLKEMYLKKEPTMKFFNEATITELSEYYTPETGYMYDTVLSQDKSPRHFYESEIELIEPKSATISDIVAANPGKIMIIKPSGSVAASAPATKQSSGTSARQQTSINNQIRALVKEKGSDRSKYSAQELALLKLYEGAGAEKKTSTDARILDQFFTPQDIVAKMWGMCLKHGFKFPGSSILEPAVGSGRFLSFIPKDMPVTADAYDVDEIAANICRVLYPHVNVYHKSFETLFFKGRRHIGLAGVERFYDLVIGNPPYRDYVSEYAPLGEKDATGASTFEMYFIARGVDVLKPGGLLCYIIPNSFMSNDNKYNDFKEKLAKKCDLVDGYRLPNGVFSNTDAGTDIILLKRKGE